MYHRSKGRPIFLATVLLILSVVLADYANYVRRGNKLELAMEPVSSTIQPVPIYKLSPRSHRDFDDSSKYEKNVYNVHEKRPKQERQLPTSGEKIVKIEPVN